jgi:hypothetical protein
MGVGRARLRLVHDLRTPPVIVAGFAELLDEALGI